MVEAIDSGCTTFENGESWENWWILPRVSEDEARDFCEYHGIHRRSGRPGSVFQNGPYFEHTDEHTIIRQGGGWDI